MEIQEVFACVCVCMHTHYAHTLHTHYAAGRGNGNLDNLSFCRRTNPSVLLFAAERYIVKLFAPTTKWLCADLWHTDYAHFLLTFCSPPPYRPTAP